MKQLFIAILAFVVSNVNAQKDIKLEEASKHVGDSVKVCGQVSGVKFFKATSLKLINMGGAFPHQLLTAVIHKDARATFEKTPEELFENKNICVTGKIEMFKGKPQIVIGKKEQVSVQ